MRWPLAFVMLALAGCSDGEAANSVDLSAAATEATADIGNYAAVAGVSRDEHVAGDIVRGFAAALSDRRWPVARNAMHRPQDSAPVEALRRRYDRFVTRVGKAEPAAGGRGMAVPIQIVASPRRGVQQLYDGEAVLIPGPAAGPVWMIDRIDLSPPLPATATAIYDCRDRTTVTVRFDNLAQSAMATSGRSAWRMEQQVAASGVSYEGGGAVLRGKGRDADWAVPDRPPTLCRAR